MPEVFLSYRQTSAPECQLVRAFAERLRSSGFNVIFDQFSLDDHPGDSNGGWDKWSSDHVLHISTIVTRKISDFPDDMPLLKPWKA